MTYHKRKEEEMKIKSAELETVCGITSKLPDNSQMEIAFAGRSNVGKSTLINGLLNRKSLARTSSQPGKTQTLNFYHINREFYLVDLPGYGYARVSRSVKEQWGKMIERYLKSSKTLRLLFLLVDIRHEPNRNDIQMYDWAVKYGFNPIIIATKSDKINRSQRQKHLKIIRQALGTIEGTPIIPYTSMTKDGRDEIWEYVQDSLEAFAGEDKAEIK